jgi:16S rRNA (uracil1498-N3)-methyltransferase
MTRRRWIADQVSGNQAVLTGSHADHLIRVLRARVGQEFDIVAGEQVHRSQITKIENGRVELELGEVVPGSPTHNISILLAIFKFDRMEWAIEKCTELGVNRIIPVVARRTDAHLASAAGKRCERWQRIALQASEQSRRSTPPEITAPIKFREAIGLPGAIRIVLSESESRMSLRDVLRAGTPQGEILLAIGPEGGWTDEELQVLQSEGWVSVTLGHTILRAETAAIAATALAVAELL